MKIKTGKLEQEELKEAYNSKPQVGDNYYLNVYNEANYFVIKKFYQNDKLVGYGVIFLGHNGIENQDVAIEDIVYWGDNEYLFPFIRRFDEEIKNSMGIPFPVNNIYYDPDKFIIEIDMTFDRAGFSVTGRTR